MSERDVNLPVIEAPAANRFVRAHMILIYFTVAAAVVWLLSGFYQVQPDEVAIVERLGQFMAGPDGKAETVEHGLHYHLPWPIDRVHVISIQQRLTLNVKTFNVSPSDYEDFKAAYLKDENNPFAGSPVAINAIFNPYLIAADKSVLHMEIAVNFRVRDPEKWLQAISHEYQETYDSAATSDMRNTLLQRIAQRAMIQQAARLSFDDLLLEKRDTLPATLQTMLTDAMVIKTSDEHDPARKAEIDLGIDVLGVQVTAVRPPDAIKPVYDRVLEARLGRDTAKANARAEANGLVAQAKAQTSTLILDAEQYKNSQKQAAAGEASRFKQVLDQYLNTPDVTRWNLYVESMTAVTGNATRIFFVHPGDKTYIYVDPPKPDASKAGTTRPGG